VPREAASGRSRPTDGASATGLFLILPSMEALLASIVVVAVGEIGDKTQLLALMLAVRLRRPVPVVFGILVATLANHTLAALVGDWVRQALPAQWLRWLLAASFFGVALWALKADEAEDTTKVVAGNLGAFALTAGAFFIAEMGDKTQIATAVLAAQFGSVAAVVAGTTLGMLIADVPVVLLGNVGARRIPFKLVRRIAAALFALMGVIALVGPLPG
jgi:putative Ca2+/H+ antiporter (TMEM165/GDT1 family)